MFQWFQSFQRCGAFSKTFKVPSSKFNVIPLGPVVPDVSNVTTSVRIRLIRFDYLAVYPLERFERSAAVERLEHF
jgi:hypothetical protein